MDINKEVLKWGRMEKGEKRKWSMDVCGQEVKESGIDAERETAFINAYLSKAETKS